MAERGVWDMSLAGWSTDWYGDAAKSFFEPLFNGSVLPPSSSNFGLFNDPTLNPSSTRPWPPPPRRMPPSTGIRPTWRS